jgi:hypothetical protein
MQDPREDCEATPLKVGSLLCFKGICLCMHSQRRYSQSQTEITAKIHHRILISNDTVWPSWIESVRVQPDREEISYYFFASLGLVFLTALLLMCCVVRMIKRYIGYQKVIPPDEEVTESTRLTS